MPGSDLILTIEDGVFLALHDGAVVVLTKDRMERLTPGDGHTGLLPLLEAPLGEVIDRVQCSDAELSPELRDRVVVFLVVEVPLTAIRIKSTYWTDLALTWMENAPALYGLETMRRVEWSSWASQRVRHRARGLRKILERD